ncbi:MAG TPA: biotin-dependent carboxyltransferase family protein [Actinomycetales bacterium]|nr:biotin-dependent carboxyltransferase family protein [Actinomycetales bacterium]
MNENRSRAVEILATGPLALVQDLGRPGLAALGISRSGAADRGALRLANRLLANDEGTAAIEVLLGGLAIRPVTNVLVAVTGADVPITIGERTAPHHSVLHLRAGEVMTLGTATRGLRAYVAVRGGLAVPPVLGSRSRDTLSGIGPAPLQAGQTLPVGDPPATHPVVEAAPVLGSVSRFAREVVLHAAVGPRVDWVADPEQLTGLSWTVSEHSTRVGLRLEGAPLARPDHLSSAELDSEGIVRGAVQIPPHGRPVVFGPDHPVTGGYPVVAVLRDSELDRLGQLRPGQRVRLRVGWKAWARERGA